MAVTESRFPEADVVPSGGVTSGRSAMAFAAYLALAALIALVDYETGYDVRLATLYLFPIGLAAWRLGPAAGTFMAVASTFAWLFSFESLHPYTDDAYFYWEGISKAATFLFVVWLVTQLRRAVAHADQRFVTVLDGLAAAVFVESPHSEVLFANPRFRQKFGATRPAVLPRDLSSDFAGEVHDAAAHRWFLVRSRPLRWIDGQPVTLRLLSDITEEKRVRELMEGHRDALHRNSRLVALGEFASAIAHEINQPLTAIATYNSTCLRLLEAGQADSAELREAMQKCREQAKRAGAIIRRLREFLRQPAPALAEQDLNSTAIEALQAVEVNAAQAGVELKFEPAAELPRVRMDPLLIEQVLLNLVRNAIEAVQGLPQPSRRVVITTEPAGAHAVRLSVADRGAGVAAALKPKLFEAFVSDKPGGLGLGLAICRSVVESHGGTIAHEESAPGARFSFILPVARA